MGGHILWTPSNVINPIHELIEKIMGQESITLNDIDETLGPVLIQAALSEQVFIIQQLLKSGMTKEEVSFRLNRDYYYIDEIADLELEYGPYDYSSIKGAKALSDEKIGD